MERLNGWEAEVWRFLESLPPPSNTTGILGHASGTFVRLYLVFGVLYFEFEGMFLVFGDGIWYQDDGKHHVDWWRAISKCLTTPWHLVEVFWRVYLVLRSMYFISGSVHLVFRFVYLVFQIICLVFGCVETPKSEDIARRQSSTNSKKL